MYSPTYIPFLTNDCFTKLAFWYDGEWIGFENPISKEQYMLMRDDGCPPNEILQRLVRENILKIGDNIDNCVLLLLRNNVCRLVDRHIISVETINAKYSIIPTSLTYGVVAEKINETTESDESSDDGPAMMSDVIRLNDISEVSTAFSDDVAKTTSYEIPYDIIIDMRTTNPDDFNLIQCCKQFKKHYELTDEMLLSVLLKREPNDENDKRIAKMFDIRFETNSDVKCDLPVLQFEEYQRGYLMELFLEKLANKMHYIVDMKKNSKLYDLVRVIKETNANREEIHAVINAIMMGDCINKAETIAVVVKELI